jgi:hypothetical protein
MMLLTAQNYWEYMLYCAVSTFLYACYACHNPAAPIVANNNNTVWRNLEVALASERNRSYPLHMVLPHPLI